jgi:Tol biopolymer transport system component
VAFLSDRAGDPDLYRKRADFSGPAERILTREYLQTPMSWSSDSKLLIYQEAHPATGRDIWVLPLEGDGEPRPFLQIPFNDRMPDLSPDGRWMAYYSDESGQSEVYVQPFPGPGRRLQISTDGGRNPVWSPNGRELFYVGYPRMIMAVDVVTEPDFTAGTPRVLFEAPHFVGVGRGYDITPDGQRFVMVRRDEEAASPAGGRQLNVVLNWFEELKRLVPVKN